MNGGNHQKPFKNELRKNNDNINNFLTSRFFRHSFALHTIAQYPINNAMQLTAKIVSLIIPLPAYRGTNTRDKCSMRLAPFRLR